MLVPFAVLYQVGSIYIAELALPLLPGTKFITGTISYILFRVFLGPMLFGATGVGGSEIALAVLALIVSPVIFAAVVVFVGSLVWIVVDMYFGILRQIGRKIKRSLTSRR